MIKTGSICPAFGTWDADKQSAEAAAAEVSDLTLAQKQDTKTHVSAVSTVFYLLVTVSNKSPTERRVVKSEAMWTH